MVSIIFPLFLITIYSFVSIPCGIVIYMVSISSSISCILELLRGLIFLVISIGMDVPVYASSNVISFVKYIDLGRCC